MNTVLVEFFDKYGGADGKIPLLDLYAFALNTTPDELTKAIESDENVRDEVVKAMTGKINKFPEAFNEYKKAEVSGSQCEGGKANGTRI